MTGVLNDFHFKILASEAFKAPSTTPLILSPTVEPEETTVKELELGYRIGSNSLISVNLFDVKIDEVITYNDSNITFSNGDEVHTRGYEMEYRYHTNKGFVALNHSTYSVENNTVDLYQPYAWSENDGDYVALDGKLYGASDHKTSLYARYNINDQVSVMPSLVYTGSRYSIEQNPEWDYSKLEHQVIANLHIRLTGLVEGLETTFALTNLKDERNVTPNGQYSTGVPHVPNGIGRRLEMEVAYDF